MPHFIFPDWDRRGSPAPRGRKYRHRRSACAMAVPTCQFDWEARPRLDCGRMPSLTIDTGGAGNRVKTRLFLWLAVSIVGISMTGTFHPAVVRRPRHLVR